MGFYNALTGFAKSTKRGIIPHLKELTRSDYFVPAISEIVERSQDGKRLTVASSDTRFGVEVTHRGEWYDETARKSEITAYTIHEHYGLKTRGADVRYKDWVTLRFLLAPNESPKEDE